MGIVSFDFDGTLCCIDQDGNSLLRANPRSLTLFNKHKNKKDKIYIITYRNPENETVEYKSKNPNRILIQEFLDEHGWNFIYQPHIKTSLHHKCKRIKALR